MGQRYSIEAQIQLDQDQLMPGDVVSGKILLKVEQKVRRSDYKAINNYDRNGLISYLPSNLMDESWIYSKGYFAQSFEMYLPKQNIPPSAVCKVTEVSDENSTTTVIATIQYKMVLVANTTILAEKQFQVFHPPVLNTQPVCTSRSEVQVKSCFFRIPANIEMYAELDKNAVYPGEKFTVRLDVLNKSNIKINLAWIYLRWKVTHRRRTYSAYNYAPLEVIQSKYIFPAHIQIAKTVQVPTIVSYLRDTATINTPKFKCEYYVEIGLNRLGSGMRISLPLDVYRRPPAGLII
eukprot:TRINITY_DN7728_c0_g1_i1.p1 TRINITY_DN7728_c0_g1~~TRINITY_DN7728_c0_g1_i1.p1  ORF type:complete len:292 (+),score=0.62 TRINITY_DN7728_c0_g1_i1:126-1001(+)